jgi:hypothetical protein
MPAENIPAMMEVFRVFSEFVALRGIPQGC